MQIDPNRAIEFLIKNADQYAKAKATRIQLEEYRKSLKSILMQKSGESAIGAQEREAYAHQDYIDHIKALALAVEAEEALRWKIEAARLRVDVWRSQEASNRAFDRAAA